jgi:O-antigen/teichoic acid export membrane protein
MAGGDPATLRKAFTSSIRLLWIVSLPIALAICAGADALIQFLAPKFMDAAVPMRILIWITVLSFLSTQFRFLFAAVGQQHILARLIVAVFLIEAAVELALIPYFSYFGACAGSMVGETFFTVAGLYICRRVGLGGVDWGALVRSALAGAAMGAVLWFTRNADVPLLLASIALSTLLYFGLCVALGALRWAEVRGFYQAIASIGRRRNGLVAE